MEISFVKSSTMKSSSIITSNPNNLVEVIPTQGYANVILGNGQGLLIQFSSFSTFSSCTNPHINFYLKIFTCSLYK